MSPIHHEPAHHPGADQNILKDQEHLTQASKTDATHDHDSTALSLNKPHNPESNKTLHDHHTPSRAAAATQQSKDNTHATSNVTAPPTQVSTSSAIPCYTICDSTASDNKITCANAVCPRKHFHLTCTSLREAPGPGETWLCTLCQGWVPEFVPSAYDPNDGVWECPKCGHEVVHDDNWLSDGPSQKPTGCEECGLEEGEAWERERRGPYVYSAHNSFLFEQQEPRAKRAIDKVARSERAALLARKRARR
jgi:hypothetical protein